MNEKVETKGAYEDMTRLATYTMYPGVVRRVTIPSWWIDAHFPEGGDIELCLDHKTRRLVLVPPHPKEGGDV